MNRVLFAGLLPLLVAAVSSACQGTETPTAFPKDAMGRPAPETPVDRTYPGTTTGGPIDTPSTPVPVRAWQWTLEASVEEGAIEGASAPVAGGLRAAVSDERHAPARVETHVVEEGVPAPIPVGTVRWPEGGSPSAADAVWAGTLARVEWLVSLRPRGVGTVEVEAVPRLAGRDREALLEEYRIHRTLSLGQALVIGTTGERGATRVAEALVGAREGKPGRLVLRVRS